MKTLMLFVGVATCALAYAQVKVPKLTPEQIKAGQEEMLRRTGGRIAKPGTQKGEIVYVNCQSAAKPEWLKESVAYFTKETRFKISLKEGKFDLLHPEIQGSVSLFVVDDPSLPNLLSAPENRWAMVNVAPLKCAKEPFFEARVKKELTRGFAYLCSGLDSTYNGCVTGPIAKPSDLDTYVHYRLPVDVLARFQKGMPHFGVTSEKFSTYLNACNQGWAPAPTNEYQKAIWDKVHEMPTEPIKIKPEVKKVEK